MVLDLVVVSKESAEHATITSLVALSDNELLILCISLLAFCQIFHMYSYLFLCLFLLFETGFLCVIQVDPELTVQPRLTLNS